MCAITTDTFTYRIKKAQEESPEIKKIKDVVKTNPYDMYFLKDDVLYKLRNDSEILAIPEIMKDEIIKNHHEKGHFGIKK